MKLTKNKKYHCLLTVLFLLGACSSNGEKCETNSCNKHGTCNEITGFIVCDCQFGYAGDYCEVCAEGFETATDGTCRRLFHTLIASDRQKYDQFGHSVSTSGNVAIVGTPFEDGGDGSPRSYAGAAYIFQLENGEWLEEQKLTASDSEMNDEFGFSVAISGNVAFVGARYDYEEELIKSGSVYVFQLENGVWLEKQRLIASIPKNGDTFGSSVAVHDDFAIIGTPLDDDGGEDSGAAYIFQRLDGQWQEVAKLKASESGIESEFGSSVSIGANKAIIGAYRSRSEYPFDGAAYIFEVDNGKWVEKQKLTDSEPFLREEFGYSVSINGDVAIVGSPGETSIGEELLDEAGAVTVFQFQDGQWIEEEKLTASDASSIDHFGSSVSLVNGTILVGSPDKFYGTIGSAGAAYVFRFEQGAWLEKRKFTSLDAKKGENFGWSVSTNGEFFLVGAPNTDLDGDKQDTGIAYMWEAL